MAKKKSKQKVNLLEDLEFGQTNRLVGWDIHQDPNLLVVDSVPGSVGDSVGKRLILGVQVQVGPGSSAVGLNLVVGWRYDIV